MCARALLAAAAFALLSAPSALAKDTAESAELETLNADADRLYREGRFDEAIPLAERALSIQKRVVGPRSSQRRQGNQSPRFALQGRWRLRERGSSF